MFRKVSGSVSSGGHLKFQVFFVNPSVYGDLGGGGNGVNYSWVDRRRSCSTYPRKETVSCPSKKPGLQACICAKVPGKHKHQEPLLHSRVARLTFSV